MDSRTETAEPTTARRNAQLKQMLRLARCVHPEKSKVIKLLAGGGYIEYCSDCNRVTEVFER